MATIVGMGKGFSVIGGISVNGICTMMAVITHSGSGGLERSVQLSTCSTENIGNGSGVLSGGLEMVAENPPNVVGNGVCVARWIVDPTGNRVFEPVIKKVVIAPAVTCGTGLGNPLPTTVIPD